MELHPTIFFLHSTQELCPFSQHHNSVSHLLTKSILVVVFIIWKLITIWEPFREWSLFKVGLCIISHQKTVDEKHHPPPTPPTIIGLIFLRKSKKTYPCVPQDSIEKSFYFHKDCTSCFELLVSIDIAAYISHHNMRNIPFGNCPWTMLPQKLFTLKH